MNAEESAALLRILGGRIRDLRQQAGLSVATAADRAHLTVKLFDAVEAGQHEVAVDDVFQIANALEITPADLFSDDTDPSGEPPEPLAPRSGLAQ